jgi:hypothetical protein
MLTKEALGEGKGNFFVSSKQAKWRSAVQQLKTTPSRKRDDVVPMEIDAAQIRDRDPKRAAEIAKLRAEGKCYKCQVKGHLKRDCPEWGKNKAKPPPYQAKARSTNAADQTRETGEGPSNIQELARSMSTLDDNKRDQLFDLLLEGEDF